MGSSRKKTFEAPARRKRVELSGIRIVVEHDPDPDTDQVYQRGEFVGVYAEAEVVIESAVQVLRSSGLWGIESDYFEDIAVEEYSALRDILKTIGVPTSELPQATLETARSLIEWRE